MDRCRRYRHFGTKSRSPGVADSKKERVIVLWAGRSGSKAPAYRGNFGSISKYAAPCFVERLIFDQQDLSIRY